MASGHRGWSTAGLFVLAVATFVALAAFLRAPVDVGDGWTLRASSDVSGPQGVIATTEGLPTRERAMLDLETTYLVEGEYAATLRAPATLVFTTQEGGAHVVLTLRSGGVAYAADCWTDRASATSPGVGPVSAGASHGRCEFDLLAGPRALVEDVRWRASPSVEGQVILLFEAQEPD